MALAGHFGLDVCLLSLSDDALTDDRDATQSLSLVCLKIMQRLDRESFFFFFFFFS